MKGKENVVFKAFMTVHSELTFVTIFGEDVNDQLTQSVLISVRNAIYHKGNTGHQMQLGDAKSCFLNNMNIAILCFDNKNIEVFATRYRPFTDQLKTW